MYVVHLVPSLGTHWIQSVVGSGAGLRCWTLVSLSMRVNKLLWATLCVFFLFCHHLLFFSLLSHLHWEEKGNFVWFSISHVQVHISLEPSLISLLCWRKVIQNKSGIIKQDVENIKLDYIALNCLGIFKVLVVNFVLLKCLIEEVCKCPKQMLVERAVWPWAGIW